MDEHGAVAVKGVSDLLNLGTGGSRRRESGRVFCHFGWRRGPAGGCADGGGDYSYADCCAGVSALIIGRRTADRVRQFGASCPQAGLLTWVFTARTLDEALPAGVLFIPSDAAAFVRKFPQYGGGVIRLVGGAKLAWRFHAAGLSPCNSRLAACKPHNLAWRFHAAGLIGECRVLVVPVWAIPRFSCDGG